MLLVLLLLLLLIFLRLHETHKHTCEGHILVPTSIFTSIIIIITIHCDFHLILAIVSTSTHSSSSLRFFIAVIESAEFTLESRSCGPARVEEGVPLRVEALTVL